MLSTPEKLKLPITVGLGIYRRSNTAIDTFSKLKTSFLAKNPDSRWDFVLYASRDHLTESVRRFCPHILIVSSYWGHSGWGYTTVKDPESEICTDGDIVVSYYINRFLRETIEDRKKRDSVHPFIILVEDFVYQSRKYYQEMTHYDVSLPETGERFIMRPTADIIDQLIKIVPDNAFVPSS